jgi:hypothetical protein
MGASWRNDVNQIDYRGDANKQSVFILLAN